MRSGDAAILLTKSITVEIYFVDLRREPYNPESAFSQQVQCLLDRFISFYASCIESSKGNDLHVLSALLRRLLQLRVSSLTQQQVLLPAVCSFLLYFHVLITLSLFVLALHVVVSVIFSRCIIFCMISLLASDKLFQTAARGAKGNRGGDSTR